MLKNVQVYIVTGSEFEHWERNQITIYSKAFSRVLNSEANFVSAFHLCCHKLSSESKQASDAKSSL